jgi:chromosome segregation ATPase
MPKRISNEHILHAVNGLAAHLERHDRLFDAIGAKLLEHDARFEQIDRRFDGLDRKIDRLTTRVEDLERRIPA